MAASPLLPSPSATPQLNNKNKSAFGVPTEEITTQWPSYDNLAKLCSDANSKRKKQLGGICGLFSSKVTITQKIDGSNLACWVRHNPRINRDKRDLESWEVLLLQGRNQPIFRKKGFDEFAERAAIREKEKKKLQQEQQNSKNDNDDDQQQETEKDKELPPFDEKVSKRLRQSLQDDLNFMATCLPQYGHCKTIGRLIYKMQQFSAKIALALDLDEVEVFGEAFRAKYIVTDDDDSNNQKVEKFARFSSWHPFGYKNPKDEWKITRLISSTHELFSRFAILEGGPQATIPKNHAEFMDFVTKAQDHTVFPPPLYASNVALIDGLTSILPLIVNPPDQLYFEGVFIVSENGDFGTKFKTGVFEEQKRLPTAKDCGIFESEADLQAAVQEQQNIIAKNPDAASKFVQVLDPVLMKRIRAVFGIMMQIFKTKEDEKEEGKSMDFVKATFDVGADDKNANNSSGDENWNKAVKLMNEDIKTACDRELGKRLSFAHFPVESEERTKVIEDLVPLVVAEVIKVYEDSENLKMPYTKETLMKRTVSIVKGIVQAVPYQKIK